MPRKLSDDAEAYNAVVAVVNARDETIAQAVEERNRAARAAEALFPTRQFLPVRVETVKPKRKGRR
jgi:hypothetical protein